MKRNARSAVCLAFLLLTLTSPAPAQSDHFGVIETHLAGRKIITERYGFNVERDGELSGWAEMTYAEGFTIITGTQATESRPIHFSASITRTEILAAQFNKWPVVYLRIANQPNRERVTKASVVLETFYWHHYLFLLRQYERGKGDRQKFFCLIPGRARELELSVELADTTVYEVADWAIQTRHYKITSADEPTIDLWTNGENRPLLFAIEAQQVKAIQRGWEALAEVIIRANTKRPSPGK